MALQRPISVEARRDIKEMDIIKVRTSRIGSLPVKDGNFQSLQQQHQEYSS